MEQIPPKGVTRPPPLGVAFLAQVDREKRVHSILGRKSELNVVSCELGPRAPAATRWRRGSRRPVLHQAGGAGALDAGEGSAAVGGVAAGCALSVDAGLVVAVQHGLEMENALDLAKELYVDVNIFQKEHKARISRLEHLPTSCWESADRLQEKREYFEKNNVFHSGTIDNIIKKLKSYHDIDLSERLYRKQGEIKHLVDNYLHCM